MQEFWKIGRPTWFEEKLAKSLNKHGSPFSFVFPKKIGKGSVEVRAARQWPGDKPKGFSQACLEGS